MNKPINHRNDTTMKNITTLASPAGALALVGAVAPAHAQQPLPFPIDAEALKKLWHEVLKPTRTCFHTSTN